MGILTHQNLNFLSIVITRSDFVLVGKDAHPTILNLSVRVCVTKKLGSFQFQIKKPVQGRKNSPNLIMNLKLKTLQACQTRTQIACFKAFVKPLFSIFTASVRKRIRHDIATSLFLQGIIAYHRGSI